MGITRKVDDKVDFGVYAQVSQWIAVLAALRSVLEHVTIADPATAELPPGVTRLVAVLAAWK